MANYERLSPGVYRGPNGALVHKGGRPINPQEARQMQGGRQVQMKPQPMGLPPQQQFDGMQYATRQDFNAGQAPMDEVGMSGNQFGSMSNQMNAQPFSPQGAPATGGPATMGSAQSQRPQRPQVTAGERLSPGVYRGSDGSLVGKNGRPLPNQGGGGQGGGPQPLSPWMGGESPPGAIGPNDPRRWNVPMEEFDRIMGRQAPPQQGPNDPRRQMPPQGMPARPIASAPPAGMPTQGQRPRGPGVTGAPPNKRRGLYGGQLGG